MWKLSIEDDQGHRTVVNLVRDEYSIGRAEDNTIRLTERNISRRHARLAREKERWYLDDLQSYNGVYVNGVRIVGRQELAHGDLVQLGDYRVELMDEALATREQGHRRMPTDPLARKESLVGQPDRFVMLIGPTQGAEFPLNSERIVIGRGEECDFSINHASVSRVHAEVRKLGDGRYEIVDKGSANGVRVNGVDMQRALLDARDVIELGDVVLKFIPKGEIFLADAEDSKRYALPILHSSAARDASRLDPKVLIVAASVVLLAVGAAIAFTRSPSSEPTTAAAETLSDDERVLQEAVSMADDGDVFGAHERLRELSSPSSVADKPEYRRIEAEWADAMLQAALGETDNVKKRAILEEVARTPSVDSQRRSLAVKALGTLESPAVGVEELDTPVAVDTSTTSASTFAKPRPAQTSTKLVHPPPTSSEAKATATPASSTADQPATPAPLPSGDEPW